MTEHTPKDQEPKGTPHQYGEEHPFDSYSPDLQQFNQPYPVPPYQGQFPNYPTPASTTNNAAVVSFIASISSLLFLWMIPLVGIASSIVGVVYGHKSLKESKTAYSSNRGLGIAGLACGYVGLFNALCLTLFILYLMIPAKMEGIW